jgi:hypothetical protein
MPKDDSKAWDARLIGWMQRGSSATDRHPRASVPAGIVGGIAGGALADGKWWYFAGAVVLAAVYRMVRWTRGRPG